MTQSTPDDATTALERATRAAADAIRRAKRAHWPQRGNKGDLHEATYALHVGSELRILGAHVFAEVQLVSRSGCRLDLLALHPLDAWALAVEFKCLRSGAADRSIERDVRKLSDLRLRRSSGDIDVARVRCFTALAASSWQEKHERWWCAGAGRPEAPEGAPRAQPWHEIDGFLRRADPRSVTAVDLQVATRWPHRLLLAVRPEPELGTFWR